MSKLGQLAWGLLCVEAASFICRVCADKETALNTAKLGPGRRPFTCALAHVCFQVSTLALCACPSPSAARRTATLVMPPLPSDVTGEARERARGDEKTCGVKMLASDDLSRKGPHMTG